MQCHCSTRKMLENVCYIVPRLQEKKIQIFKVDLTALSSTGNVFFCSSQMSKFRKSLRLSVVTGVP